MKRFLSLWLVCCLLTLAAPCALAEVEDYTVAGKLFKQLWAGSGFTGTLEVAFESEGLSTAKPIVADVDYIYVRPDEGAMEEHRLDLTLMDGENALSAAHVQLCEDTLALQADAAGPDWYVFASQEDAAPSAMQSAMDAGVQEALAASGAPAFAQTALTFAGALLSADGLDEAIEPYKTRIDVWIEAYRQDAVLDKLADGTTTMSVSYKVAPEAIKTQVKQLVLDMLSDRDLLLLLGDALGEDMSRLFLNPYLRDWYFEVIDQIPLKGDLTIARTVSLKGETINLHLSLPFHDAQTGAATLVYDRSRGEGDLPDSNTLALETADRTLQLVYQEYSSMTGVKVMQGVVSDKAKDAVQLAAAFTLKREETTTVDAEGREVYGVKAELTLKPDESTPDAPAFAETDILLDATFSSPELKSAPTEMKAVFSVADDKSLIELQFSGASCRKWTPDPVPAERVNVYTLTQEDLSSLLGGAGLRLAAALADHLTIPQPAAETVNP